MVISNDPATGTFPKWDETALLDASWDIAPYNPTIFSREDYMLHEDPDLSADITTHFSVDLYNLLPHHSQSTDLYNSCLSDGLDGSIYDFAGLGPSSSLPCTTLLQPCSVGTTQTETVLKQQTVLNTLGEVAVRNEMSSLDHTGPTVGDRQVDKRHGKRVTGVRFPHAAVKTLKDWMLQHLDHPYPNDEAKVFLGQQTSLSPDQISNWMANNRRKMKMRSKRSAPPNVQPSSKGIDIPAKKTWEFLDPLERWKHSPTENEPASMNAIARAAKSFGSSRPANFVSGDHDDVSNSSTGTFSIFKAPSVSSANTGFTRTSSKSLRSDKSAYSHESQNSVRSINGLKSKERRRRRRLPALASKAGLNKGGKLFQCTFCTESFKAKYDWLRHEKSLHLSLEKWICAPLGEVIEDTESGRSKCVYCDTLEPSREHLATHNHTACAEKSFESRTFYRKDHLRQHMRLMHNCKMTTSMESWKSGAQYIKSRCGFCGQDFDDWQERADHLAKEFRNGANMKDWKGCRGLDAFVAAHVTNAMPPYLIADESKTPFPFSAGSSSHMKPHYLQFQSKDHEHLPPNNHDHLSTDDLCVAYREECDPKAIAPIILFMPQTDSKESSQGKSDATSWEILTLRLGRFARQHTEKHGTGSVTDDMLQHEARLILYGEADGWEQTAADNAEWLNLFKQAHGMGSKAPIAGISAQHEVYEDLGIHKDSVLDSSFNIDNFECTPFNQNCASYRSAADKEHESATFKDTDQLDTLSPESELYQSTIELIGLQNSSPTSSASQIEGYTKSQETPGMKISNSEFANTSCLRPYNTGMMEIEPFSHNHECSLEEIHREKYGASSANPMTVQCRPAGGVAHQRPTVNFQSFSTLYESACRVDGDTYMQESSYSIVGEPITANNLQYSCWEELPMEFRNASTSADFPSISLANTTNIGLSSMASTKSSHETWDISHLDLMMDTSLGLDISRLD